MANTQPQKAAAKITIARFINTSKKCSMKLAHRAVFFDKDTSGWSRKTTPLTEFEFASLREQSLRALRGKH
jgi:hypothetical protein